jgi:hypothetical protein
MTITLIDQLTRLPSVDRFQSRLIEDLKTGRSALVLVNRGEYAEVIRHACYLELSRLYDYDVKEVDATPTRRDNPPLQVVSSQLELASPSDNAVRSLDALFNYRLPEIISVRGLDELTGDARQLWFTFAERWASLAQSRVSQTPLPCLWIMSTLSPADRIPRSEVWLRVFWWWSLPAALEIQLLCHAQEVDGGSSAAPIANWRAALLPGLAGNDFLLAEVLWDVLPEAKEQIFKRLSEFAAQQGWTAQKLRAWGVPDLLRRSGFRAQRFTEEPVRQERELWAQSIIGQTPEQGIFVSSSALAALGEWEQLEHRLWRGQASLILPLIDEFRLFICQDLTRKFGRDWPTHWWEPKSDEEKQAVRLNPLATEWGHLENLIRNCKDLSAERHRLSAIMNARYIRNQLAHYKPITFQEYNTLLSYLS